MLTEKMDALFQRALNGVYEELKKIQNGETAIDTEDHLTHIYSELKKLMVMFQQGMNTEYHSSISRMIVDQWPYTNQLGQAILEIVGIFEKCQSKKRSRNKKIK